MSAAAPPRARSAVFVGAALVLITLNLRSPLAAVPPVLDDIRATLHLSAAGAGLLTTAPVLCFGLAAPFVPLLTRRLGQEAVLLACLLLLAAGTAMRVVPELVPVFGGTIVLGVAIAVANVLMPSVIKRRFPRPGAMMGLFTMTLSLSAALAAAFTVPLERALGDWWWALGVWALPVLVVIAVWAPEASTAGRAPTPGSEVVTRLRRDRIAWFVTATFALQSFLFYCLLGWTPDILRDAGVSSGTAGALLSVAMLGGIPTSLVLPVIAGRLRDQRPLAVVAPAFWLAGLVGLLVAPADPALLWMALLGIGQGTGISLALTLVVLRAPDGSRAASLSGMAQGVGYVLAAGGPSALGALHDLTGGWEAPVAVMIAATFALLATGLVAGRTGFVQGT